MTGFPKRGEVYYAEFPVDTKARPAVVVSVNRRNELANTVIVVPVTTNPRPGITHVPLEAGDGGLERSSVARCENIETLPKTRLSADRLGSPLSEQKMREIERAICRAIGIPTV